MTFGRRLIVQQRTGRQGQLKDNNSTKNLKRAAASKALDWKTYSTTDVGNAEMFADTYKDSARYVSDWKRWVVWDGKRWATDNRQAATLKAMELVRYTMPNHAKTIKDDDARAKYLRHIASSQNKGRIDNLVGLAAAMLAVGVSELDSDSNLFNCQNGTIDCKTGILKPHN